jgi:hypothetical protein
VRPFAAVLGSNFLGTTSFLLSLDGGALAGRLRLDSLIPIKGYKRCVDYQNGFGKASSCETANIKTGRMLLPNQPHMLACCCDPGLTAA